jgi:hypothetical protein
MNVVDHYFEVWNETDAAKRRSLIERTWAPGATYVDPLMAAEGPDEIDAMVAGVHQQFPGHRFRRTGGVDAHNGRVRFAWELVSPEGAQAATGLDFGEFAEDGRFRAVTGFLGPLPEDDA